MDDWTLTYQDFNPEQERLRETLLTLGNGYFSTRGAQCETQACDHTHYPGTYLAGGYNQLTSQIADQAIINEDLVNFPNWLTLKVRQPGEEWLSVDKHNVLEYKQELNLKAGLLSRQVRFKDKQGRETSIHCQRLVHMDNPHLAAIHYQVTAHNWSGPIEIFSGIDGSVTNSGVKRYNTLENKHFNIVNKQQINNNSTLLQVTTSQSAISVTEAARTQVYTNNNELTVDRTLIETDDTIGQLITTKITSQQTLSIEKVVALYAARDKRSQHHCMKVSKALNDAPRYKELAQSHQKAWHQLWQQADIIIESSGNEQLISRLHIFHVLQTLSPHTPSLDVGAPARGWHGEAYRGHVFWDELFIFPFLNATFPQITRSLLMYRYRRLDAARALAQQAGYKGAMFPWQSARAGDEQTQVQHLNPLTQSWGPDYSHLQRHVNIAIAYNIQQYCESSDDTDFMHQFGIEMLLEIARFWVSITHLNPEKSRFEIHNVMGPDEYHEQYPNNKSPGINNNAYTNVMVAWLLSKTLDLLNHLPLTRQKELKEQLSITEQELKHWENISHRMKIPFIDELIIAPFDGFDQLKPFNFKQYKKRYNNICRVDRILKAENSSPNNYQVMKQADTLMLFYLLSHDELTQLFTQLSYPFKPAMETANLHWHTERTSHGSTLSKVVHAEIMQRVDPVKANEWFTEALNSDIHDTQGGTTCEGIHLGVMAGTLEIITRQYAGIHLDKPELLINPQLPSHFNCIEFRFQHRKQHYHIKVNQDALALTFEYGSLEKTPIKIIDEMLEIQQGETVKRSLNEK